MLTQTTAQTYFQSKFAWQSIERVLKVVKKINNFNTTGISSIIQGNVYFSLTWACFEEKDVFFYFFYFSDVSLGFSKNSLCVSELLEYPFFLYTDVFNGA